MASWRRWVPRAGSRISLQREMRAIDASGRIVMPAFNDPDTSIVNPHHSGKTWMSEEADEGFIRVTSRRIAELRGATAGAERARYGWVNVGCNSACATDLRS